MAIPPRVHFVWIGPRLSWAYVFAILSAAARGALPEVILHHTDTLADGPELRALRQAARVRLSPTDAIPYLTETGGALGVGDGLAALYNKLTSPVMRADVLRAAILHRQGGIYLDLDTVTTASLQPLLDARHFIGCEFIVWPHFVKTSRSPILWARSLILDLLRKAMRRKADGWKTFRRFEKLYYRGVNNAVMGAEAGSPLLEAYLRAMLMVPADRLGEPYALGPDLLQGLVANYGQGDLIIHPPPVFYPLPPEISEHWFREGPGVELDTVLSAETRVAHWYASVRSKPHVALIDPAYIRAHRDDQLYSALVFASIDEWPGAD